MVWVFSLSIPVSRSIQLYRAKTDHLSHDINVTSGRQAWKKCFGLGRFAAEHAYSLTRQRRVEIWHGERFRCRRRRLTLTRESRIRHRGI